MTMRASAARLLRTPDAPSFRLLGKGAVHASGRDLSVLPSMTTWWRGEVRARARKTLNQMEHEAGAQALAAKEKLFAGGAGSSAQHTSTPPKKKNNKGQVVMPYSPDCGLSPDNPGRHGRRSSRCIITDDVTPKKA